MAAKGEPPGLCPGHSGRSRDNNLVPQSGEGNKQFLRLKTIFFRALASAVSGPGYDWERCVGGAMNSGPRGCGMVS